MVDVLPHLNASLNGTSTALLVVGWVFARNGRERPHRACMISALLCSTLFLVSYLIRYSLEGTHVYPGDGLDRNLYLAVLITHVPLAAAVPVLALRTAWLAGTRQIERHRRFARIALPIWLYVSVTGVVIYWMLYHYAGV